MALTTQQRSQRRRERAAQRGEETLRLPVMAGTKQALLDLMQRHGITEQAEALTLMIHNLHALPASESAAAFAVPRHEHAISANVARHIQAAGRREAARLDRQEA